MINRRTLLATFAATLGRAADQLPANRNIKWALSSALWTHLAPVKFTDILDLMRDTGFIGIRVMGYPEILKQWGTATEIEREVSKRNLHLVTISFEAPVHDRSLHSKCVESAQEAMRFLQAFGADRLQVYSPPRSLLGTRDDAQFRTVCDGFNKIGEAANKMGFQAGLHNHLGQIVETAGEIDRVMALTEPALFRFSPDTAHLNLAGASVPEMIEKYKYRLMFVDYKDARWTEPTADVMEPSGRVYPKNSADARFFDSIYDLGDGEIDFPACHRILRSVQYKGWICVALDRARHGARESYDRCGRYIVNRLEPIYR